MVEFGHDRALDSNDTVGLGEDRDFVSDIMVGLRSDLTVGLHGYCKGLVTPTSRSNFLRDPLLIPTLWLDEVLIATSFLFVRSTVTSRSLISFNCCGLKLTIHCAVGPGLLPDILTVY